MPATLVVESGRIAALDASAPVPEGAIAIDVTGKVIIPGLVVLHSHVGGGRLHEQLGGVQPAISAARRRPLERPLDNPVLLHAAGVRIALITDNLA